jgi:hypothetical protein
VFVKTSAAAVFAGPSIEAMSSAPSPSSDVAGPGIAATSRAVFPCSLPAFFAKSARLAVGTTPVASAVPLNETKRAMQAMTSAGLGVRSLPIMIQLLSSVGSSPRVSLTAVSAGLHRGCTTPDIGPVATNSPGC